MKLIKGIKSMLYDNYRSACKKLNLPFNKYDLWLKTAKVLGLSKKAKNRLNWIIYYYTKADQNASLTCRHFGILRSQWYYWFKRFNEQDLTSLEDKSSAPQTTRKKEYTTLQYVRVVKLRKQYIRYGKFKLLKIYQTKYPDEKNLTLWNIQCIIQESGIYYKPAKNARTQAKRAKAQTKKRITELKKKPKTGYLICLDSIHKYINGKKKYIITAIDKYGKLAYARMYNNHSSLSARDFLLRLSYLLNDKIENVQTDNGSEFMKHFDRACFKLNIPHYFSRVRTPQDNAVCERFNRTLQEEFIALGNLTSNTDMFNQKLTEWLVEYNFNRPHYSLNYLTPIEFNQKYMKVSERWSSSTGG